MRPFSRTTVLLLLASAGLSPIAPAGDAPRRGSLVIVGGGGMPENVRDKFIALAGDKAARIVVIPTASESADVKAEAEGYLQPWRKYQPAGLTLLHTRSRDKANDPEFA